MAYEAMRDAPRATRRGHFGGFGGSSDLTPARMQAIMQYYTGALAGNLTDAQYLYNWAYHRGAQYPHGAEPAGTWAYALSYWLKFSSADPSLAAQAAGTTVPGPTIPTSRAVLPSVTVAPVPPGQPPLTLAPAISSAPSAEVATPGEAPVSYTPAGATPTETIYEGNGISGGTPPTGTTTVATTSATSFFAGLSPTEMMLGAGALGFVAWLLLSKGGKS